MNLCCYTRPIFCVLLFVIAALIAGCGQMGPLEYTAAQQERIQARDKARDAKLEAAERERAAEENDDEQQVEVMQEDDEDPIQ